jgi:ribose transport system substrate-binding protein
MKKSVMKLLVFALVISTIAVLGIAGCTTTTTADTTAAAESQVEGTTAAEVVEGEETVAATQSPFQGAPDEVYHMLVFVTGVEYWIPVYEMFKECGKQLGVKTVYSGTPEYDINKELTVFEQVVATNPTGIYLCPMQPDPFIEPINRAIESGIAITTFATDSPKSNRQIFITSDNVREGTYAANRLAEEIGGKGKLAVLRNPGQLNHDIRCDTFIKTIEENWPDIEIVADSASNQDPEKAYQAVLTMAQKDPDLGGVFMPEANSGMGAAQAAEELGGNIKVLCCDVNKQILDMIKAGQIWGAINPNQGMQGYFGMLTLFVTAHPELVDPMNEDKAMGKNPVTLPFVDNGLSIVTAENVDYYYLDKYLERRGSKGVAE